MAGTNVTAPTASCRARLSPAAPPGSSERAAAQGRSEAEVEKEFFEKFRPTSLIKRFADPDEVAALVVCGESSGRRPPPVRRCASTAGCEERVLAA
jgi:hypothetical protein